MAEDLEKSLGMAVGTALGEGALCLRFKGDPGWSAALAWTTSWALIVLKRMKAEISRVNPEMRWWLCFSLFFPGRRMRSVAIVTRDLSWVGLLSLPTREGGCVSPPLSSKLALKNNNF